jgi:hypothetical protein
MPALTVKTSKNDQLGNMFDVESRWLFSVSLPYVNLITCKSTAILVPVPIDWEGAAISRIFRIRRQLYDIYERHFS